MANLKEQLESFEKGIIIDNDGNENTCYNFYDWFCNDSSLRNKAIKLFKQVKTFLKYHPEIDLEKTYVFFKNNCPVYGSLYDDFRICNIESGDVIYTVVPKTGHNKVDKAEVWGRENGDINKPFQNEPLKTALTYIKLFK